MFLQICLDFVSTTISVKPNVNIVNEIYTTWLHLAVWDQKDSGFLHFMSLSC